MKVAVTADGAKQFIFCPACKHAHGYDTARWRWNGEQEKATFTPSHVHTGANGKCHINVTDGIIIFHPDCEHPLRGTRVPLPDIDS